MLTIIAAIVNNYNIINNNITIFFNSYNLLFLLHTHARTHTNFIHSWDIICPQISSFCYFFSEKSWN